MILRLILAVLLIAPTQAGIRVIRRGAAPAGGGGGSARTKQAGTAAGWSDTCSATITGATAGRVLIIATMAEYATAAPLASQISGTNIGTVTLLIEGHERHAVALFKSTVTANGDASFTYTPPASGGLSCALMEYSGTAGVVGASAAISAYDTTIATGNLAPSGNAMFIGVVAATAAITKNASYAEAWIGTNPHMEVCDLAGSGTKTISWTIGANGAIEAVGVALNDQ